MMRKMFAVILFVALLGSYSALGNNPVSLNFYNKTKQDVIVRLTANQKDPKVDFFQILAPAGEIATINKLPSKVKAETVYIWATMSEKIPFKLMTTFKTSNPNLGKWEIIEKDSKGQLEIVQSYGKEPYVDKVIKSVK